MKIILESSWPVYWNLVHLHHNKINDMNMSKITDKVEIYQTKHDGLLFRSYDMVRDKSLIKKENYEKVYAFEGSINYGDESVSEKLELIFSAFNRNHPIGFKGHSLSVSDVVYLNGEYFFCDSFGFKKVEF